MRFSSSLAPLALSTLIFSIAFLGCAKGGGSFDGGTDTLPGFDANVDTAPSDDADPMGMDSSMPMDSSTPDTSMPDTSTPMDTSTPDTSMPDTSMPDTSMPDTARPDTRPPPECERAADCTDGMACNGAETCVSGRCRPGTPVVCNDSIACTTDRCVDPAGTCSFTPRDAACAGGQMCDATMGCISTCSESPCRLVSPQCGCGAGEGCYLSGTRRVCGPAGTVGSGADCGTTNCRPGNICIEGGSAADGPAAPGSRCLLTVTGTTQRICTVACTPETNGGCRANTGCQIFTESMTSSTTLTDCVGPTGTGGQGASCVDDTGCRGGFSCLETTTTGNRCLKWCRMGFAGDCAGTPTCRRLGPTGLMYAGREYGVCL